MAARKKEAKPKYELSIFQKYELNCQAQDQDECWTVSRAKVSVSKAGFVNMGYEPRTAKTPENQASWVRAPYHKILYTVREKIESHSLQSACLQSMTNKAQNLGPQQQTEKGKANPRNYKSTLLAVSHLSTR